MAHPEIKTTVLMDRPPGVLVRDFKRAKKQAMFEVVAEWHSETMPEHFKDRAVRKYGYQKRTKRYQFSKFSRFGHTRPLEFSGLLKAAALPFARITDTFDRASLRLGAGTQALNFSGKFNPKAKSAETEFFPDMDEELGAVTATEERNMATDAGVRIAEILNEAKPLRKVI